MLYQKENEKKSLEALYCNNMLAMPYRVDMFEQCYLTLV